MRPATKSRWPCPESVTSEAYMRPSGRLASRPVSRCAHAKVQETGLGRCAPGKEKAVPAVPTLTVFVRNLVHMASGG